MKPEALSPSSVAWASRPCSFEHQLPPHNPPPRFRYLFDPLFLFSVAAYFFNRYLLKPHFSLAFLHNHLNDLLCIPVWLPILLVLSRILRLRSHNDPPRLREILIPLLIWSWLFEALLPAAPISQSWCTPDPFDLTFYTLGALLASLFWRCWYRPS